MPNYGKTHYPNDVKGITDGKPMHVVERASSFGDWTKEDIQGRRATRSRLAEYDDKYWKMPGPSKIKYS